MLFLAYKLEIFDGEYGKIHHPNMSNQYHEINFYLLILVFTSRKY